MQSLEMYLDLLQLSCTIRLLAVEYINDPRFPPLARLRIEDVDAVVDLHRLVLLCFLLAIHDVPLPEDSARNLPGDDPLVVFLSEVGVGHFDVKEWPLRIRLAKRGVCGDVLDVDDHGVEPLAAGVLAVDMLVDAPGVALLLLL